MNISLMHAGLAAGAALAAIPIILHLFMRQTPKHVIFPALRLIRERHKKSKKQLKIKNWLLLAARMLLFMLMALALARPSLNSESSLGDQEVPSARAFVFDTSMSMQYTEKGNDRLTEAKLRANEILKKTTDDSEIWVIDSADPRKEQPLSPIAARKRIDALTLRAAYRPLNAAVVQASQSVAESKLLRREVYVLTDLAGSAWELGSTRTTEDLEKLRKDKNHKVSTYILKLTPSDVRDVAVISAEPTSSIVAVGEPVEIKAILRSTGPACERVVDFQLDGNKRGEKVVKIPANGESEVTFTAPANLSQGLHQGRIKLGTGPTDFLAFDDVRYFTFKVQPALNVLIVADLTGPDDYDASYVRSALVPSAPGANDPIASPYRIERETRRQFQERGKLSAKDFVAVFLLNIDGLTATEWGWLSRYVQEGGGLVIAPGDRSTAASYSGTASSILPATLEEPKQAPTGMHFGKVEAYDHPLFNSHPQLLDPELTSWPIYRYWSVKPMGNSRTLLRFGDGSPALIERAVKGTKIGHVLLWTTPLSRRPNRTDPAAWNEFPYSWAFVDIINQTIPYLAGTASEQLNYEAGQEAILTIDPNSKATSYTYQGPDSKAPERLNAPTTSDMLVIPSPQQQGQWKVEGKGPNGVDSHLGFSVNVAPAESQVVALKNDDLNGLFGGKDNFQVATNAKELVQAQKTGWIGYDLFPWLMFLILGLVTAENLLANKFHRNVATA